jgi:ABC-2 type transport system permease protein
MFAIYKKELRSYFTSMIGYVFIAFFLVIIGFYFALQNLFAGDANFGTTLSYVTFIFVLLAPLLTMRLMAEENKQKTDQLLLTSPLSASSIIIGKFLAVFTVFLTAMLITCTYPLILKQYGNIPMTATYTSILVFTLLGGAYLIMGLFISSLTESQVVAAVISFLIFLFTVYMEFLADIIPGDNKTAFIVFFVIIMIISLILYRMMRNLTIAVGFGLVAATGLSFVYRLKPTLLDGSVGKVFGWLSVTSRFSNLYYGVLKMSDVFYYLSIIFLFTFLSTQVIKKKRWS